MTTENTSSSSNRLEQILSPSTLAVLDAEGAAGTLDADDLARAKAYVEAIRHAAAVVEYVRDEYPARSEHWSPNVWSTGLIPAHDHALRALDLLIGMHEDRLPPLDM